jgi:drug/metabolite transporter (DMT)-like permease
MASSSDYLKLHFIVFLWGFSAILGKLVTVPAVELVFFRSIFAAAGLAALIYFSKGTFNVGRSDLVKMLLIGFIVALHWLAFFGAARISNVSVSLVGFATNSLWAALLEPWFNKTRLNKIEVVLGLIVIAGLYIIFSFDFQYQAGLLVGIFAGFTSALFSVFNSRIVKRISARTITFYEMAGAFLSLAIFIPLFNLAVTPENEFQLSPTGMDFLYIAILAGVCSVYASTVATELMKRISVFMIQLTLNLEPVYGIIMAVIIFEQQEKMNANFYIGTIVILSAVVCYPMLKKRFDKTVLID